MMTLVYGTPIPQYANSKAELFFEGAKRINALAAYSDHPPVDFFPILRYVLERCAPWKTLSRETREIRDKVDGDLFSQCEEAVRGGKKKGGAIWRVSSRRGMSSV
ncbi:hypothetical protein BDN71DRAFT_1504178 [Pleurotus eryngii]|uniref:Uncharacterized protein n=1 Tax=Pleurotus eryngii TaxID=5323 RepID=A0A9P6A0Q4_PLEER|nr:hypothetical protein BDN71DRAFT_1504178 [Pleurotus eryngii]